MTNSRCKIIFLIPSLGAGGAERVVLNLITHMNREKFDITLAVIDLRNAALLEDVPADVTLLDLNCKRVLSALPRIISTLWRLRPSVLFTTLGYLNLAISIVKPILPSKTKYIARESSIVSEVQKNLKHSWLWRLAYRKCYPRLDLIICQSEYMMEDLRVNYGFPVTKMKVINNPIDLKRIKELAKKTIRSETRVAKPNSIHLIAVGRLTPVKGFDLLIEAIHLLSVSDKRFSLTIIGDGPLKDRLNAQIAGLNLSDQIHLLGFQINPYPFIAKADALILSSLYEGFPNVVLEAIACGTPVIATPAPGGTKEILDNINGCLMLNEISSASIAEGIKHFNFGHRIDSAFIMPYDISSITQKYETELLENVRL